MIPDRLFDSLPIWFGVLGGGVVAIQMMTSVRKRMRMAQRRHNGQQNRAHAASRVVREQAAATLALKREARQMERELAELDRIIQEGEQQAAHEKAADTQLYVFDERKNVGDAAFLIPISHSDFNSLARGAPEEVTHSWKIGRRYLVWAASEKMALAKASMRFNQDKGYRVGAVAPFDGDPEAF